MFTLFVPWEYKGLYYICFYVQDEEEALLTQISCRGTASATAAAGAGGLTSGLGCK